MQTPTGAGKQRTKVDPKSDYERMLGGFCNCNCCDLFILSWWILFCTFEVYLAIKVVSGMSDDKWVTAACMAIDGTILIVIFLGLEKIMTVVHNEESWE